MSLPDTASDFFGSMAATYDSLIRRAVPRYDEMVDRLVAYLPPSGRRILELGSGTGNLTLRLAGALPGSRITTVDASPEMIDVTRSRLAAAHPQAVSGAEFITARFEDLSFAPGSFDLVVSCMSLHHVREKAPVYIRIGQWLSPGGAFRLADQFAGANPEIDRLNWDRWLAFCREPGNCSEAEIESLVGHAAAHDHYTPIPEQFRMLTDAGFRPESLDCVWRNWMYGIITADR